MGSPPRSQRASDIGVVREPSAPKKNRPSPIIARCSATDTISRISTVACASGRNARRYTSGPMGTISASTASVCPNCDVGLRPHTRATAINGSSTAQTSVGFQATRVPRRWRQPSTASVSAAMVSSIQMMGGTLPVCSAAMASAA